MALLENLKLKQLNEKQAEVRQQLEGTGREILKEVFDKFFEKVGDKIEAVRWKQYTPYFNDGDTCKFSVRDTYFKVAGVDEEAGDYGDGYIDTWCLTAYEKYADVRAKLLAEELDFVKELSTLLQNNDELLLAAFGDHAQITATKDGFEDEEYSHD